MTTTFLADVDGWLVSSVDVLCHYQVFHLGGTPLLVHMAFLEEHKKINDIPPSVWNFIETHYQLTRQ